MPSLFPELFTYELFAPVIIRVAAGIVFLILAYFHAARERAQKEEVFASLGLIPASFFVSLMILVEGGGGLLLLGGAVTQAAAAILSVFSLGAAAVKTKRGGIKNALFYVALAAMCASLLVSGPGLWAFDLPL